MISNLDHLIIAVKNLDEAENNYQKIFGMPPVWRGEDENLGTKKLCGINISSKELKFSTTFAIGSNDTVYNDPPKDNKLYKCAYDNLESYIDYILKKINSNG